MATLGNFKTIFSFWEPQGSMTPYLRLCKKTWERHLSHYNIVFLDYSNLDKFLPPDTFDLSVLKQLKPMLQKDAVMIGVLREQGGIFMDADTIVTKDISPIINKLKDTEMVMFNTHLAFVAARPGSYVLDLWLKGVQRKLKGLAKKNMVDHDLNWDFFGNSVLSDVMDEMIYNAGHVGKFQKHVFSKGILAMRPNIKDSEPHLPKLKIIFYKLCNFLKRKERDVLFDIIFKKRLMILDRLKYGFIPEANYFKKRWMTAEQKYVNFWFENIIQSKDVFMNNQMVIGLHNSWTPQWYKDLSEQDILDNDCLLSRTLKDLIKS